MAGLMANLIVFLNCRQNLAAVQFSRHGDPRWASCENPGNLQDAWVLRMAPMDAPDFTVIFPAAGNSRRYGGADKLLADLGGWTVLQRAVQLFTQRVDVADIVVATGADRLEAYRRHLAPVLKGKRLTVVVGGRQARWESVYLALTNGAVATAYVAVHDAARPLTPPAVIDAVFAVARQHGAAVPLLPEAATLKRVDDRGLVRQTVDRDGLFQAQTPQCFRTALLREAFEKLRAAEPATAVTDDAQVVENAGGEVMGTPGSPANIKITTLDDLPLAEALLQAGAGRSS